MSKYTIFHNPRCSKSRQTLALMEERGLEPEIRLYLEDGPTVAQLKSVLASLGISARALLRKGEEEYKALGLKDASKTEAELIDAMVKHPRLIERPIVIDNESGKAVLGRPPENVLDLI